MTKMGMIRRIDELGRVVIPKEIRSLLQLNVGEQLEIFLQDDKMIVQRFSRLQSGFEEVEMLGKVLSSAGGCEVAITDNNKVIWSTMKECVGQSLTKEWSDEIRKRQPSQRQKMGIVATSDRQDCQDNTIIANAYILPILSRGDLYGSVTMWGEVSEKAVIQGQFVRDFLRSCIDG